MLCCGAAVNRKIDYHGRDFINRQTSSHPPEAEKLGRKGYR